MGDRMSIDLARVYDGYWTREYLPPLRDQLTPTRRRILWSLMDATRGRVLLDCGSGDGALVAEARQRGWESTGIDVAPVAIRRARRAHPDCQFREHSIEVRPWPIPPGSVDYVVSFEVIEHLVLPQEFVSGAFECLRSGGHVALTTPYHGLLKNLAIALTGFESHFDVAGDHLRFFTDRSLRRILEGAGFEIERLFHFGRIWGLWAGTFVWARKP
jgi:2-polyprenyl-3-methyl-5-hydroxy-6-metoxy-1,4-benzoquinol methylase